MSAEGKQTGIVFRIQRFSLDDGPGIRTCIFLKGCPLRCEWCHNPEGNAFPGEISYIRMHCICCSACAKVCTNKAHIITSDSKHIFRRTMCKACGECCRICPTNALELVGRCMSAEQVVHEAAEDIMFFGTDGGLTLTGGEPMAQPEFAYAIAKTAKEMGLSVCMETSGHCDYDALSRIQPLIDEFLYDYKETDAHLHERFTGVPPEKILSNLHSLDESGAHIVLRCPLIPGRNLRSEHYIGIAKLASTIRNLVRIDLEPYHPLGAEKRMRLGIEDKQLPRISPNHEDVETARKQIASLVTVPVYIL